MTSEAIPEVRLDDTVAACRALIDARFEPGVDEGAAAMVLEDGTILTGTAPEVPNPSVELCHETEPFCAAYRLGRRIVASVCLYRDPEGRYVVLAPCGVCRERLAVHGPKVLVAVPSPDDPTRVRWKRLSQLHQDYWRTPFLEPAQVAAWRQDGSGIG